MIYTLCINKLKLLIKGCIMVEMGSCFKLNNSHIIFMSGNVYNISNPDNVIESAVTIDIKSAIEINGEDYILTSHKKKPALKRIAGIVELSFDNKLRFKETFVY